MLVHWGLMASELPMAPEHASKKVILVTDDPEVIREAKETYREGVQLVVTPYWSEALDWCRTADVLVVDLLATLEEPHKIGGYVKFAEAKRAHKWAKNIPLVLIDVPEGYKLNGMVGWPNFVRAYVRRPVTSRIFRRVLTWI